MIEPHPPTIGEALSQQVTPLDGALEGWFRANAHVELYPLEGQGMFSLQCPPQFFLSPSAHFSIRQ